MSWRTWLVLVPMGAVACGGLVVGCGGDDTTSTPPPADGGTDGNGQDATMMPDMGGMDVAQDTAQQDTGQDVVAQDSPTDGTMGDAAGDSGDDGSGGDGSMGDGSMGDGSMGDGAVGDGGDGGDGGQAPCDPVTNATYYVDPINGSDAMSSTGSDSAGGQPAGRCAFKTITHALSVIGKPTAATKIIVIGTSVVSVASNGESFPLVIPAFVHVTSTGGAVTVLVPPMVTVDAGSIAGEGFILTGTNSGLDTLVIDGGNAAAHGVLALTGTTLTTTIGNLEVRNFADAGMRVQGSGQLTINDGTNVHNNGVMGALAGLHVSDTGHAEITAMSTAIHFDKNTSYGVLVTGSGSVIITGPAAQTGMGGLVTTNNNNIGGVRIFQDRPGVGLPPANAIAGLSSSGSTSTMGGGIVIGGGSNVSVRRSYLLGNINGVAIIGGPGPMLADNTDGIDLGKSAASDPGRNALQGPTLADAGLGAPNTGAGLCATVAAKTQIITAEGNLWTDATSMLSIDCTTSMAKLTSSNTCTGAVDYAGSAFAAGPNGDKLDPSSCLP